MDIVERPQLQRHRPRHKLLEGQGDRSGKVKGSSDGNYCPDGISVEHIMDSLATACHATEQRWENDSIFLSGPLYIDDSKISGHQYHAKYVRRGKLLFVQMLTYPDDCKKSVSRLVKQIDDWKVW